MTTMTMKRIWARRGRRLEEATSKGLPYEQESLLEEARTIDREPSVVLNPGRAQLNLELERSWRWVRDPRAPGGLCRMPPSRRHASKRVTFQAPERSKQLSVDYEVFRGRLLGGADEFSSHRAGPYDKADIESHRADISTYEGVRNVKVVNAESQRQYAARVEEARQKWAFTRRLNAEKRGRWGPNSWKVNPEFDAGLLDPERDNVKTGEP